MKSREETNANSTNIAVTIIVTFIFFAKQKSRTFANTNVRNHAEIPINIFFFTIYTSRLAPQFGQNFPGR